MTRVLIGLTVCALGGLRRPPRGSGSASSDVAVPLPGSNPSLVLCSPSADNGPATQSGAAPPEA